MAVRPLTRAVINARPDANALMSTDAPRAARDATPGLLMDQSTRGGILPERVATDATARLRRPMVMDAGNGARSSPEILVWAWLVNAPVPSANATATLRGPNRIADR